MFEPDKDEFIYLSFIFYALDELMTWRRRKIGGVYLAIAARIRSGSKLSVDNVLTWQTN